MLNIWGKPLFQSHKTTVTRWWLAENIVLIRLRFVECLECPEDCWHDVWRKSEFVPEWPAHLFSLPFQQWLGPPVFPPLSAVAGPTCFPTPFSSGWAHLFSHPFQQWLGPPVFPPLSAVAGPICFPPLSAVAGPTCFPTPFSKCRAHLHYRL